MDVEYHDMGWLEEIPASDLTLPRSLSLYSAIKQNNEYSLIKVLRAVHNSVLKFECLVVDVTCDQVPSRSSNGILYRERLLLKIDVNEKQLIHVLALRKNFPILLHQNQTRTGTPAQLCLYFDGPENVFRTWTPQNFLKRIIWWLEKSSRGELHASDQPVEGLFFYSRFELVLPSNFRELQAAGTTFTFIIGPERQDKGMTIFAWPVGSPELINNNRRVSVIELALPPIVHSQVEQSPYNMGDLINLFQSKDINLIDLLKTKLAVPQGGVDIATDYNMTVFVITVPIKRTQDADPERVSHYAFFLPVGLLTLGINIGFLMRHENKVFNDAMGTIDTSEEAAWRKQPIDNMTVLHFNSAETSRLKSGVLNPGPQGILVGVGALGSVLLDLWTRSGWGVWTVIDEDHLKPHNLVRHIGTAEDVGLPKVDVAAQHAYSITLGATKVIGINADGGDFSNQSLLDAHKLSSLVVDASTTINYPRLASKRDDVARHISVFVTPNGDSSVLLAEDQERKTRLRTLEAQYYRALINQELGQHNLYDTGGSFISGSSCRDISFIMPYSKIMNHATTLSEQVMTASETTTSAIRVWNRSDADGSVNSYHIAPEPEICLSIDDFDIYLDEGLVKKIRSLRTQGLPNETGGILLGYYDFNVKTIVIVDVLSAPADSLASPTSFERGTKGTQQQVQAIAKMTADMVGYIGEWHSHPAGHSAKPSKDDFYQILFLSLGMAEDGFPAISLIMGENDMQVLKCEAK
ncbi:ThiF family adenylyltransferase [Methylotenera sp.]|uniref:ThiF family adenylyltransferase n=1 Tax=Methylotenera sp. TaxID=2051956 RepID=UPI0027337E12|nr:ThiF family adenylyltransferase [Methylotenera sp.]MDP3210104.1 ThiF family adenylyltransferase [Methylotenera sp.]